MTMGEAYLDLADNYTKQSFALYGGHRLWHGYSPENSQDNNWDSYVTRPKGGYMDDLWIYTKVLDFSEAGKAFKATNGGFLFCNIIFVSQVMFICYLLGKWQFKSAVEECVLTPGASWDSRFTQTCTTVTPTGRAGHGSAFDSTLNGVWIFGGYNTYYPYLSTDGTGSGEHVEFVLVYFVNS
jgi:hypothetical protein